jgi:putative two-component system response regulator
VKSILIVDDNLVSLKQVSAQLAQNYEVSLAKSGELALQICAREKPDLILLDVEMPGMDGFATITRLKEDPRLQQVPVIFLTGNRDTATEVRCLESGAVDFITKPAHVDILHRRIEMHLQFDAYQHHPDYMVKELEDNIGISFAELLECKDFNLINHVLNTSQYVKLLMEELLKESVFGDEITAENIGIMKRAAPFHDIGKIGISDILLFKKSALTDIEYQEVRKHAVIGARVLKAIYERAPDHDYLKTAITIAEGHHEHYDGTGYPHGLKGDAIPLNCRIMAVANVYNACVTDRVYRKKLSHEEACAVILAGRGTEFDPRVVDAFDKVRNKFAALRVSAKLSLTDREWSFYHETNIGG